jgi:hypothetical protein
VHDQVVVAVEVVLPVREAVIVAVADLTRPLVTTPIITTIMAHTDIILQEHQAEVGGLVL